MHDSNTMGRPAPPDSVDAAGCVIDKYTLPDPVGAHARAAGEPDAGVRAILGRAPGDGGPPAQLPLQQGQHVRACCSHEICVPLQPCRHGSCSYGVGITVMVTLHFRCCDSKDGRFRLRPPSTDLAQELSDAGVMVGHRHQDLLDRDARAGEPAAKNGILMAADSCVMQTFPV